MTAESSPAMCKHQVVERFCNSGFAGKIIGRRFDFAGEFGGEEEIFPDTRLCLVFIIGEKNGNSAVVDHRIAYSVIRYIQRRKFPGSIIYLRRLCLYSFANRG